MPGAGGVRCGAKPSEASPMPVRLGGWPAASLWSAVLAFLCGSLYGGVPCECALMSLEGTSVQCLVAFVVGQWCGTRSGWPCSFICQQCTALAGACAGLPLASRHRRSCLDDAPKRCADESLPQPAARFGGSKSCRSLWRLKVVPPSVEGHFCGIGGDLADRLSAFTAWAAGSPRTLV